VLLPHQVTSLRRREDQNCSRGAWPPTGPSLRSMPPGDGPRQCSPRQLPAGLLTRGGGAFNTQAFPQHSCSLGPGPPVLAAPGSLIPPAFKISSFALAGLAPSRVTKPPGLRTPGALRRRHFPRDMANKGPRPPPGTARHGGTPGLFPTSLLRIRLATTWLYHPACIITRAKPPALATMLTEFAVGAHSCYNDLGYHCCL
jgi:hypothetical protein